MSHYSDHNGTPDQGLPSIFAPAEQKQHSTVSNLTKNLMLSTQSAELGQMGGLPRNAPLFTSNKFVPVGLAGSIGPNAGASAPSDGQPQSHTNMDNAFPIQNYGPRPGSVVSQFTPNSNANYIPLGHNTPTQVSSSYTLNYSYTPTMGQNEQPQAQPGFLAGSYKIGAPTTNISMDLANLNLTFHTPSSSFNRNSFSAAPPLFEPYAQSLPGANSFSRLFQPPQLSRLPSDRLVHSPRNIQEHYQEPMGLGVLNIMPQNIGHNMGQQSVQGQMQPNNPVSGFPVEPDHYMTYQEYLALLNKPETENDYEEHLNVVDFPVNDLITMLACLLTKIIEANDKLHPNHFDNTIAIRQKLKKEKKLKKLERARRQSRKEADAMSFSSDGVNTTVEHISDHSDDSTEDEEDELKNRYLANVLAFHGTNVPGISLHAYLTRVLKYCPVTNEVFLLLLVYFDRIAKKANNLRKKKRDGEDDSESEQLFVMDSYNIHRLIILGITVSSKFFSDIFYKNLRYAKVGGLPLEELNYLELQFLLLLDFKLMISVEDLQNYGDLLLKFWKREQLASELVGKEGATNPGFVPEQH